MHLPRFTTGAPVSVRQGCQALTLRVFWGLFWALCSLGSGTRIIACVNIGWVTFHARGSGTQKNIGYLYESGHRIVYLNQHRVLRRQQRKKLHNSLDRAFVLHVISEQNLSRSILIDQRGGRVSLKG